ncbi:RNA polymerase sigma factor SigB [Neobacillus niacini]|uniref:RNA polymerase sigma factor SigB n=1 Tax=Neobacillus niacini TaxID=86668 RepID=UPI0007ABFC98|nr:RNA polymerase sigma factor SigB [Neobacillus niacini]MEC1520673.1 RNA polymerase sigma factor SigB [Neobacillus niacini]
MTKPPQTAKRTKEETYALIRDYQENESESAQIQLVEQYTNLIGSIARKYSKGRNLHEDIMQVGMIGLLSSIRRFDPSTGNPFEAYLIPMVIGEIKRFLRDKTWDVHVPRRIKETWPKLNAAVEELTNRLQRSPKIHEIAEHLGISEEEVLETMELGKGYQTASVDQTIETSSDGSGVTALDVIGSEDKGYERVDQQMLVQSALHVLDEREKQIIQWTFIENKSQREVGESLGISQMHVSRLQKKAIEKLRKALAGNNYQDRLN